MEFRVFEIAIASIMVIRFAQQSYPFLLFEQGGYLCKICIKD